MTGIVRSRMTQEISLRRARNTSMASRPSSARSTLNPRASSIRRPTFLTLSSSSTRRTVPVPRHLPLASARGPAESGAAAAGKSSLNVEPRPGSLYTLMAPL